jgi:hypothetical protein
LLKTKDLGLRLAVFILAAREGPSILAGKVAPKFEASTWYF